ncbi:hypothetical protein [Frankia tisae]|nr:hypothetical protein [Frankia tisae]
MSSTPRRPAGTAGGAPKPTTATGIAIAARSSSADGRAAQACELG